MSSSSSVTPTLATRLDSFGAETVWQEFSPLAVATGAVNLGQGFPNWATPDFVKAALVKATTEDHNQYCRSAGHSPLVEAVAAKYSPLLGREINPMTEVAVGVGASECLYSLMQAFVNPGDEVILLSPAFDIYIAQVVMAGGVCKYVPLRLAAGGDPEWTLDMEELERAFSPRTAAIILNTPHNPTGKVFSAAELAGVAAICAKFPRTLVISDEVYEHMTYDGTPHTRMATLPGMWDRTVTVCSAGKTFSCTGWKVGWCIGPSHLIRGVILTNQWVMFSVCTPAQQAVAAALRGADSPYRGAPSYYAWLGLEYARKRAILVAGLASAGMRPSVPQGGFFIIADTSNIALPEKCVLLQSRTPYQVTPPPLTLPPPSPPHPRYLSEVTSASGPVMARDWAMCRYLTIEHGVACIPPSAFYDVNDRDLAANMVRFAFCKDDAYLYEAAKRLQGLRKCLIDSSVSLPDCPVPPPAR